MLSFFAFRRKGKRGIKEGKTDAALPCFGSRVN